MLFVIVWSLSLYLYIVLLTLANQRTYTTQSNITTNKLLLLFLLSMESKEICDENEESSEESFEHVEQVVDEKDELCPSSSFDEYVFVVFEFSSSEWRSFVDVVLVGCELFFQITERKSQ